MGRGRSEDLATVHAFLDAPLPLAFAHRGGASEVPENTLPAFEHAVRLGYRYVETDVHATADGVLLAFHDSRLDRVTDRSGVIANLPYSEVSKALVGGKEPIPRFEQLLEAWPDLRINIDPKKNNAIGPLVAALKAHRALDRVCVGAFSDARIRGLRAEFGSALCTSSGPIETLRLLAGRQSTGAMCAQVPVRQGPVTITNARFVEHCHRLGVQVHVWTIDDDAEMRRLLDLGVDGIMTDRPAVLKAAITSRGGWTGR